MVVLFIFILFGIGAFKAEKVLAARSKELLETKMKNEKNKK